MRALKIGTLIRAGGLAFEIMNHQATRQLSGLVKNGMKRRGLWQEQDADRAADGVRARPAAGTAMRANGPPASRAAPANGQWPPVPVKKALKYVTPENVQKAKEWHGILKSFIDTK